MTELLYIDQLNKQYKSYLVNLIAGNDFEPIFLRGGKSKPTTTPDLHNAIAHFKRLEKTDGQCGWRIDWKDWKSKKLGKQKWPIKITVETELDYLFLINKECEVDEFKKQLQTLINWKTNLRRYLNKRPDQVLDLKAKWDGIMSVVDYLMKNDVQGLYIRSIPVAVNTKFIEENKAIIFSLLRFLQPYKFSADIPTLEAGLGLAKKPVIFTVRWLDSKLKAQYTPHCEIFGITVDSLKTIDWNIQRVLLVENETNLYLLPNMPSTLAIFSSGKALHLLKEIAILKQVKLYYWGDLDYDGFIMLNSLREYYQDVASVLMNRETVLHHLTEVQKQPHPYKGRTFLLLTEEECQAYELLADRSGRIEQERLYQGYVQNHLYSLLRT